MKSLKVSKEEKAFPSLRSAGEEIPGRGAAASPCWVPHTRGGGPRPSHLCVRRRHWAPLCSTDLPRAQPHSQHLIHALKLFGAQGGMFHPGFKGALALLEKPCELVQHHPFCWLQSSLAVSIPKCWWSPHANASFPPVACMPMSAPFPLLPAVGVAKLLPAPEEFRHALPCVEAVLV